jgi:NTE family protein
MTIGERPRVALVLSGGGARGAYELGALSVLLPLLEERRERPSIYVGTSVGAINVAGLAASRNLSSREALELEFERWEEVDRGAVIRPILQRLPLTSLRFLGGVLGVPRVRLQSLLDPAPLERNLRSWIDWRQLHRNVSSGQVRALATIATAAGTGRPVAFVEGRLEPSARNSHVIDYVRTRIEVQHVLASASIPILFPPVRISEPAAAAGWFVDGGTRLNTPIKPAVDLGADRVVVVGTGSVALPSKRAGRHEAPAPDFGVGALHLLQGALSDPLVEDMRRLGEINMFYADPARSPAVARHREARGRPPYRPIHYMFVGPRSPDAIAELARECFQSRYGGLGALRSPDIALISRLIGARSPTHGELLSYLLFDREFTRALIALGKADAEAWVNAPPGRSEPWQLEPLDALREPSRTV